MSGITNSQESDMMEQEDDLQPISEDEDSLGDDDAFSSSHILNSPLQDDITNSLTAAGTMPGLAAAAVVVNARKRQIPYKFETNPSTRRRQHTRLIRKLKQTMREFCTRCGQQAVVLCVSPGKENPNFKVFGASPLDQVIRNSQSVILRDLERVLQEQSPASTSHSEVLFELPALMIDGIPTPVDKMNQAQLRMFVPEMLKYSTGRGKPGWGKENTRPVWWPLDVPWANVRRDVRTDDQKLKVSWTQALRQIVKNCYKYHGRDDLLHCFSNETSENENSMEDRFCEQTTSRQVNLTPPTLVQTVQNSDGSVSLVQLDSGQTIATITQDQSGAAVATLSTQDPSEGPLAVTMHQVSNGQWSITTGDVQTGIVGNVLTDSRSHESGIATSNHQDCTMIDTAVPSLVAEDKSNQGSLNQQQNSHTIGITIDSSGQAVASLQQHPVSSCGQIVLASPGQILSDANPTRMVQIPVSVYDKLAKSIQDANIGTATANQLNSQPILEEKIEIDNGQT